MFPKTPVMVCSLLAAYAGSGLAAHDEGCVPTQADPATVNTIDLTRVGGGIFYDEERGNPLGTQPPVPLTASLLVGGEGTWLYEEQNGVPGLQRGSIGLPYCPAIIGCLLSFEDPMNDATCDHGPDRQVL